LSLELLNSNELIASCRNNDQQAQFEIYRRYNKAMYNTALRITNDVVLAEEATQEGFILAFRKLHQFEKENSFGGWLKKIVARKSYEYYKEKFKLQRLDNTKEIVQEEVSNSIIEDEDRVQ
tara:strand:- start:790 stop:1152 length:363 start_codon:yes stop_codon:yes gene_type:complete